MAGPYRSYTPPAVGPTYGGTQRGPNLLDPVQARGYMKPRSYISTYAPPPLGSGGQGTIPGIDSYEDIGKTQTTLVGQPGTVAQPGELTKIAQEGTDIYAPPAPVPQMGAWEGLMRGVLESFGGVIPADLRAQLGNGLGFLANLLDIPTEVIGNIPAIPFPQFFGPEAQKGNLFPNQAQFFESLPETTAKREAVQAMQNDPMNALFYMSQYLKMHETEIAHGLGVSPLIADYFVPSNNFGDQVMRTLGLLGLPGRLVSRTYAESQMRNAQGAILDTDMKNLNPELQRIRTEYEAGTLNRTEFFDEIAKTGFAFNNNIYENMLWEIFTDPLLVASFGTGIGLKLASTSGRLAMVGNTVKEALRVMPEADRLAMNAYAGGKAFDKFAMRNQLIGPPDLNRMIRPVDQFEWLTKQPQYAHLEGEELAKMSTAGQAMVKMDPLIQGAAKISRVLNNPFDLWGQATGRLTGSYKNGERIAEYSSIASTEGVVQAYGPSRWLKMQTLFDKMGAPEELKKILGRMGANAELGVGKDTLNRQTVAAGSTPLHMPDAILRSQSEVYHSRLSLQVEGWVRRIMVQFLPTTRFGKEAIEEVMAKQRQISKHKLMRMAGTKADEAAINALVDSADEEMLALIHHMYYSGPVIKSFHDARSLARSALGDTATALKKKLQTGGKAGGPMTGKTTVPKYEAKIAEAERNLQLWGERATIIGPHELTWQAAGRVLKAIKRGDATAAREAVDQYEALFSNFAAKGLSDEDLLRDLGTFLQDLRKGGRNNGRLVNEIERTKLPKELRDWFDEQRDFARRSGDMEQYKVGLAPQQAERWRAVYDKEDRLIGVNAWAESVPDVADTARVSSLSAVRDRLFRPIRGERHLEESRRMFRRRAVEDYGLSRSQANALFGAIRRAASEANTMPRGLTNSQLNDLIGKMGWTEAEVQRVGQRGMARLVASAFEGSAFTVGITQKISGRAKRVGARMPGDNWLGVVSERLYPLARFTLNPIFRMQEAAEPFFWNLLRGIKPGMHWTEEDLRSFESLRRSGFLGEWADQWEYSPSALLLLGAREARRTAGMGTAINKVTDRMLGEGRRVGSLAELKRLNYIRQNSNDFGLAFKEYIEKTDPTFWDVLVREAGSTDPARVGNYYWLNKAFNAPDNKDMQVFMYDATLPHNIGAATHQSPAALAKFHKFTSFDSLRKSIREGGYDEVKFRAEMTATNMDPTYIDNAWTMASHLGPSKWWRQSEDAYIAARGGTRKAKDQAKQVMKVSRAIVQQRAKILGFSEEEYLARQMSRPMQYVDSSSKLPTPIHYQMTDEVTSKKFYGHAILEPNTPEIREVSREARALAGTPKGGEAEMQRLIGEATPEQVAAAAPTGETTRITANAIDGTRDGPGADLIHVAGPGLDYDSLVEMAHNVLLPENMEKILLGSRRIPSMFHMMSTLLPDDVVWRLLRDHFDLGDVHENRLRVEALHADETVLAQQADLLGVSAADARDYISDNMSPGGGTDYYGMNLIDMRDIRPGIEKGPPNTGVKLHAMMGPGKKEPHTFYGWYDENGDMVANVDVTSDLESIGGTVNVPTTPGGPILGVDTTKMELEGLGTPAFPVPLPKDVENDAEAVARYIASVRAGQPEPLRITTKPRSGMLPRVNEPVVAGVGTQLSKQGRGYYAKLIEYIDKAGIHKWNDITGRGSYDMPGSRAAASLLAKQDAASLIEARKMLASRMLAGFSFLAHKTDIDPHEVLRTIQGVIEAGSGKHVRAVPASHLAVEQIMEFARIAGDEINPTWQQRAHLESLLPASVRGSDTINPSMEAARAFGYAAEDEGVALGRAMAEAGLVPGAELPPVRPNTVSPAQFAHMQQQYREWAARANADALLNRTDWTARDIQALNVARYRQAMKVGRPGDGDGLLASQAVAMNFELSPHAGTDFYEAFPHLEWIMKNHPQDMAKFNEGLAQVQGDVARWWASKLGDISGVSVVHVSVGPGRHVINYSNSLSDRFGITNEQVDNFAAEARREAGEDAYNTMVGNDEWDEYVSDYIDSNNVSDEQWAAYGPQASIIVTGSPESIEAAVHATGSAFQRREVVASFVDYATTRGTYVKPNWDQSWVSDFIIPEGVNENAIAKQIDQLWQGGDLVRQSIVMPDGRRAFRVFHEVGMVDERGLASLVDEPASDALIAELGTQGVQMQRGIVDMFRQQVDIDRSQADILKFFDDQGEFVDDTGRVIRKDSLDDWDWDSRLQWKVGHLTDPWLSHIDKLGAGHVATALRNRYRGEALAQANIAYWQHLGDYLDEWRARDWNLPPPLRGYHYQASPKGIRAATHIDNNLDASLYVLPRVNPTSIPHELVHQMIPHMDDSMVEAIVDAYSQATGWRRRQSRTVGGKPVLNDSQEEWLAEEFVKYASTGTVMNSKLQSNFNMMGKLVKEDLKLRNLPDAHPRAKEIFDQMLGQENSGLSAVPFDPDQYRHLAAARYFMSATEDQAHKTHYFARGRNFLERSVNHPYMGYYPASYMWGKVLPELLRFLVKQPFGIKAPMGGYMLASHVSQALALQVNTDPDMREWIEGHPETIRFMQMMLPGTPWDIPVNMPAWARHTAEGAAQNELRRQAGQEAKNIDMLGQIEDSTSYAVGVTRFLGSIGDIGKEFGPKPEEIQSKFDQQAYLASFGLAPQPTNPDLAAAQAILTTR